jgi:hypothetical protein
VLLEAGPGDIHAALPDLRAAPNVGDERRDDRHNALLDLRTGELECEHLPGETYDGEECWSVAESIGPLGHVALTANPDFTYTWYRDQQVATAEIMADGTITAAGDPATCSHCEECPGRNGPTAGDLDPAGRWEGMIARARAAAEDE